MVNFVRLLVALLCICSACLSLHAQSPTPPQPKQFIYVLRLVPRLHDDAAWTQEDKAAVQRHLAYFREAHQRGQLIMAGRTSEPGDKTFGIVIFDAADEAAARNFMASDPAVAAGVMTAELHPFSLVFERKRSSG